MAEAILCECRTCGKSFSPRPRKANKYCCSECYRSAQSAGLYKGTREKQRQPAPCHNCGAGVIRSPSIKRNGDKSEKVFCGRDCYDKARAKAIAARSRSCAHCGLSFIANVSTAKFCGEQCWKDDRKAKPKRCLSCNCLFTPVKLNRSSGRMISYNGGKTCSPKCENDWIRNNPERKRKIGEAFRGHLHPNWQGGKSLLNNVSNRGPNWQRQRAEAIRRDKRCLDCGISNDQCKEKFGRCLDVDHVVPFHNFSNYRKANALSNLECRCASCHRIAETKRSMIQMVLPMQESEKRKHKGRVGKFSNARLTELDVRLIRRRFDEGESISMLAAEFTAVGMTAVRDVAKRKTWRHIP